jgi:methylmalonyl-CoA carboxyltransferase 12S subunit
MSVTNESVAELQALVAELGARLHELEEERAARPVGEDVLLAISAACAAYLGKRAVVKQVHLARGSAWATAGRSGVQHSHANLRGTR